MVNPYTSEMKVSNWFLEIICKSKSQMSDMPVLTNKIQEG